MTDADVDGAHIQILLLTFFYHYMRPLIENGKLFIALPPLYKIEYGKKRYYAYSDDELNDIKAQNSGKCSIQRYKGLGEMNAEQLWETTMNPETRTLNKITMDDSKSEEIRRWMDILVGDDIQGRKEYYRQYL